MSQDNNEAASAPAAFADYMVKHYPAGTVIGDPLWHVPRIYRAAIQAASASQSSTPVPRVGGNTSEELPASVERRVQYIMDAVKWYADHKDESTRARIESMVAELESIAHVARQRQESAPTGNEETDRIIGRLMSSDPGFDDCADAANLIRRLVLERCDGAKAYCKACNAVGMSNCGNFDECEGPQCVTCHQKLPSRATPSTAVAESRITPSMWESLHSAREEERPAAVAEGVDTALPPAQTVMQIADEFGSGAEAYSPAQTLTYGAQQREAGRREERATIGKETFDLAVMWQARAEKAEAALQKINAIRNSIIGIQTINWSEHVYPLVAALDEAGYEGMEYPEAREYFGTLLERAVKAEDQLAALARQPVSEGMTYRAALSELVEWVSDNCDWGCIPVPVVKARAILSAVPPAKAIPMILHCPACGLQHIDAPDERTEGWTNPPHRSHLCHGCGHIWRPADVPTEGVAAIQTRGSNDSAVPPAKAEGLSDEQIMRIAGDVKQRNAGVWPGDVAFARAILAQQAKGEKK